MIKIDHIKKVFHVYRARLDQEGVFRLLSDAVVVPENATVQFFIEYDDGKRLTISKDCPLILGMSIDETRKEDIGVDEFYKDCFPDGTILDTVRQWLD